jgi:hypothetical protein
MVRVRVRVRVLGLGLGLGLGLALGLGLPIQTRRSWLAWQRGRLGEQRRLGLGLGSRVRV